MHGHNREILFIALVTRVWFCLCHGRLQVRMLCADIEPDFAGYLNRLRITVAVTQSASGFIVLGDTDDGI